MKKMTTGWLAVLLMENNRAGAITACINALRPDTRISTRSGDYISGCGSNIPRCLQSNRRS